jgi:hypothetical protein
MIEKPSERKIVKIIKKMRWCIQWWGFKMKKIIIKQVKSTMERIKM